MVYATSKTNYLFEKFFSYWLSILGQMDRLSAEVLHGRRRSERKIQMKYALFIYENESAYDADKSGSNAQAIVGQHMAFAQGLGAKRLGGAGLKSTATATTVRTAAGKKTVHDGPFAEAREQLGGFYLIEAADLDEAIGIAKKIPLLQDGAIEIRPLLGP